MTITSKHLTIKTDLPDIPASAPVAVLRAPCLDEHDRYTTGLAAALRIEPQATVELPHGFALSGAGGQVEVFHASGAVRARSTDQIARFSDERRPWRSAVRTEDGWTLDQDTAGRLVTRSRRLLESVGLLDDRARVDVSLGQWAQLDETGAEIDSGPGRATVQLRYESEGVALIGPGAKTNLHFDPDEEEGGALARFFHVRRATETVRDVPTLGTEEAFTPLFGDDWSGTRATDGTRLVITKAVYGLLALPADVPQRYAAPALAVEGVLTGMLGDDGKEHELRFGRYLPLVHEKSLADAGLVSAQPLVLGAKVTRRSRGA